MMSPVKDAQSGCNAKANAGLWVPARLQPVFFWQSISKHEYISVQAGHNCRTTLPRAMQMGEHLLGACCMGIAFRSSEKFHTHSQLSALQ
jgi:hypothetical protein